MPVIPGQIIAAAPIRGRVDALSIYARQATYRGSRDGLILSNNGTDATNDIDIAAGLARESGGLHGLHLDSALTKRLDAAWSQGSGNGGLDTGTIANTTYHVHLIGHGRNQDVDALFSTSPSAPTMPSGWVFRRRIGSILREGGAIVGFIQDGDYFWRKLPVEEFNANNPGTSQVTVAVAVPLGINVQAMGYFAFVDTSLAATWYGRVYAPGSTDAVPDFGNSTVEVHANNEAPIVWVQVRTDTLAQIHHRQSVSDAGTYAQFRSHGWIDTRGKDA